MLKKNLLSKPIGVFKIVVAAQKFVEINSSNNNRTITTIRMAEAEAALVAPLQAINNNNNKDAEDLVLVARTTKSQYRQKSN